MSAANIFAGHVVPSVSIQYMVQQRNAVIERLAAAMNLIWEAREMAKAAHIGFPELEHKVHGRDCSVYERKRIEHRSFTDTEEDQYAVDKEGILARMVNSIDAAAWQYLMAESGLRTFMDNDTRKEWDNNIYDEKVPALTMDIVISTFKTMHLNRGGMLEDGVVKCFQRLSWCYKTNEPFRFGPKIIMLGFGEYNHRRCDALDDLVRVFHVLDGKPEPDHRHGMYSHISEAYRQSEWPKICDTEYLRIKLFKNTNAHIAFKRGDVVEKMNEMIARRFPGALPYDRRSEI